MKVVNEDKSGSEQYRVFHQGASGFVSVQSIRADAEQRANEFCDKKGKVVKTLSEQTSPLLFLPGNFPRIEIIFTCVDKPALALPSTFEDQRYIKLTNLKKLLEASVITKEEFDKEKAKILSQP